ncbi:DUF6542 domain-containing protein [Streptosporangium sp. NPDC087985]|uniref:DUF6542 domain-containing protein n=1 Tax=Streptosporangium sp. NPDC087985 TaxID=3366196 RepID=UPI003802FF84
MDTRAVWEGALGNADDAPPWCGMSRTYVARSRDARPPTRPRRPGTAQEWPGLTGLTAVLVLTGVTAVGAVIEGLAGGGSGLVLDISVVVGAVMATVAISSGLVWLLIPMPPLVFVVMTVVASVIGGGDATGSVTRLVADVSVRVVKGFPAMVAASLLVIAIVVVRMLMNRRRRGRMRLGRT